MNSLEEIHTLLIQAEKLAWNAAINAAMVTCTQDHISLQGEFIHREPKTAAQCIDAIARLKRE